MSEQRPIRVKPLFPYRSDNASSTVIPSNVPILDAPLLLANLSVSCWFFSKRLSKTACTEPPELVPTLEAPSVPLSAAKISIPVPRSAIPIITVTRSPASNSSARIMVWLFAL